MMHTAALVRITRDILSVAGRTYPSDLAHVGEQVPLFIGPCAYCGVGYIPYLPHACPNCGIYLRAVMPAWVSRLGVRVWYLRCRILRENLRTAVYLALRTARDISRTR